jgi:hypothetical protein
MYVAYIAGNLLMAYSTANQTANQTTIETKTKQTHAK